MRPPTVAAAAARLTAVHGLVACRGRTTGRNRAVRGVCRGSARRLRRLSAAGAARGEGEHVNGVLGLSTTEWYKVTLVLQYYYYFIE